MEQGITVIRKTDLSKNIPIFGIIEGITRDGKANVCWKVSQYGSVALSGNGHHSTLSTKSLAEATPEMQQRAREAARARHEEHQRKLAAERIYVCMNINPTARVSNDGHRKPLELSPGQVKDGHCWYCKAPVFKRCSIWNCITPAIDGTEYCQEHQEV